MTAAGAGQENPELPWEQGSLLPEDSGVTPLQWVHPDNPTSKAARGFIKQARRQGDELPNPVAFPSPGREGERWMVITQSCDIIKPPDQLGQVEVARVFATTKPQVIAEAHDFGSARYFRV